MSELTTSAHPACASMAQCMAEAMGDAEPNSCALHDVTGLLPALIEHIPAGILIAFGPPRFPVVAVNRMAEALLGCSREKLLGSDAGAHTAAYAFAPASVGVPPGRQGLPLYRTAYLGERLRDEEWTIARQDGTRTIVLVNTNPLRTASGEVAGAVACLRDVTPLKALEAALRTSEKHLREAYQRKDAFLAMLAHELRGPLAPARNVAQILKVKAGTDPSLLSLSGILERQIGDMARLLEDVLDLSRVAVGKLRLDKRIIELAPVIHHALEWTKPLIARRQHRLRVVMPDHPVRIDGDAGRLAQVFANLLTNAAKYTDPGGEIEVILQVIGERVLTSVRDTGRGLDASEMQHLFDLFFQPERTLDRAEGGLGIGLSLVRSLVGMHGGTVEAHSAGRGAGSDFVISLPLVPAQAM